MDKKAQEAMSKLQLLEQNMQQLELQKQQFSAQLMEAENALKELESKPETYKIVGNIMVKSDPTAVSADLKDKQERLQLHISLLDKQEKQITEKTEKIRKEVMGSLKE
ncbi:prefoldin subunit [Candidatus Woesearchaeota archaeon]|nr:prefoldin subunit [Candidatus Woesearchaeota archaeon]